MKIIDRAQADLGAGRDKAGQKGHTAVLLVMPVGMTITGFSVILFAITADFIGLGGLPGFGARQIALTISGMALMTGGITTLPDIRAKMMGEWLLVGVATLAVTLMADLIVINTGLPKLIDKLGMLLSILLTILVVRAYPLIRGETAVWGKWRESLLGSRHEVIQYILIGVQFLLLLLFVQLFNLENEVFAHNIMLVAFTGYLIHSILPFEYRLPYFFFLSLAALLGVFGLLNGAWMVGIGLALIGICHLPFRFWTRAALLLFAGALLAFLRVDRIPIPWSNAIWPILGSMFMFRLIVYMYDLKHQKEPINVWRSLSYFFLLPNVVFPLFPVVDFSNFRRTYFNQDRYRMYQVGINWMFRGALQLVIYRFVSYYVLITPENATNYGQLIVYLVANIMLYLRVSGQFHIIVGMLHMFGFNLPESHHNYFLASSFTDYWRRINIYWKDFMLKVFYYPIYFRIKHWGATTSLVVSTLFVFFVTWILHAYQWFWLRGSFLLAPQDMLFWAILAILVTTNALFEIKRGRKRTLGKRKMAIGEYLSLGLRTAGTFAVISVLWSLWTSVSLKEWFALWSVSPPEISGSATLFPYFVVFAFVGGLFRKGKPGIQTVAKANKVPGYFRQAFTTSSIMLVILLVGSPFISSKLGDQAQHVIRDLRLSRLNEQDADLLERGYYEDLMGVNRFNSQLWEIYMKRPQVRPDIWSTDAGRLTNDFLFGELTPSANILFYGEEFTTNSWGMRDKEYQLQKPDGTYRFALIGPSTPMGWGVADDETFEWILEERLNQENTGKRYQNIEILNFSVSGYTTLQNLLVFENKVLPFEPDSIIYLAHPSDEDRLVNFIIARVREGVEIHYDYLQQIIDDIDLKADTPETTAKRGLNAYQDKILKWAYERIVEETKQLGATPIFVIMPRIVGVDEPEQTLWQIEIANSAGFTVLDLSDVYSGTNTDDILLASWDWHPNAAGHQLIADRFYEQLLSNGLLPAE
jgi:hypothetical protein